MINNDIYQRETLSERPIRQLLTTRIHDFDRKVVFVIYMLPKSYIAKSQSSMYFPSTANDLVTGPVRNIKGLTEAIKLL